MSAGGLVTLAHEDGISIVTLNRPERLNAISAPFLDDFLACLDAADAWPDGRTIILEAAGRAFSSGDDLRELADAAPDSTFAARFIDKLQDVTRRIVFGRKPVICAVQGYVVGGAVAWPLNADFSVFADDAVLFTPETAHGMFCSGGVSMLLPERCGPEAAMRILTLGDHIRADGLARLGIAGDVVGRADLAAATRRLARRLGASPGSSLERMKEARAERLRGPLEQALALEARHGLELSLDPALSGRVARVLQA